MKNHRVGIPEKPIHLTGRTNPYLDWIKYKYPEVWDCIKYRYIKSSEPSRKNVDAEATDRDEG